MEKLLSTWAAEAVGRRRAVRGRAGLGDTHGVLAINHLAPYGGVKQSGIGRKSGIEGILEYVQG